MRKEIYTAVDWQVFEKLQRYIRRIDCGCEMTLLAYSAMAQGDRVAHTAILAF
ncbi:hypothetical protein [Scytonema sp. UIC 10036]|uniref:hypothetical protein n=1 Tax=Scytonema sp. UIC 10036 TaxID=2304196 RepID=UPI001FAAE457|nr:hypothetical protein [Scytonema sp. UIC 10036]